MNKTDKLHKTKRYLAVLQILFFLVLLASCKTNEPFSVDDDIVFTIKSQENAFELVSYNIAEKTIKKIPLEEYLARSSYFKFDKTLIGFKGMHGILKGYPAALDTNTSISYICPGYIYDTIFDDPRSIDPYDVIITGPMTVESINLKKCHKMKVFIDLDGGQGEYRQILGASLSADGRHLAYGALKQYSAKDNSDYYINILDLSTGEETFIVNGFSPSLSPNGRKLAYVDTEQGIFILDLETHDKVLIVELQNIADSILPVLDWSPDGEYLLAQVFIDGNSNIFDNTMYIIDTSNANITSIESEGIFPSWVY